MLYVGLDVGSVSVKLAALGADEDSGVVSRLWDGCSAFFVPKLPRVNGWSERPVVCSAYRRTQGNPLQAASDLLREFHLAVPDESIACIRFTGSGGRTAAAAFNAEFEDDFRTLVSCIRVFYPQVRTVFELGGETSKYIRLGDVAGSGNLGVLDYQSSTECAAGTGSFIDQQASRLQYVVEDVGEAACNASCAARVAGRCSVFAKTDMIHAQQKGYTADQILRGLCEAVARNFKSSIVKGRQVVPPVAFVGGVAMNAGVFKALREAFGLQESDVLVPDLNCWMPALGASLCAIEERGKCAAVAFRRLPSEAPAVEQIPTTDPLSLDHVTLLRNRTPVAALGQGESCIDAYLGIDVGSVSTNLVVLDAAGHLLKEIYVPTSGRPIEVVSAGLREIEEELGSHLQIRGVGTTGSGRELIGELTGADTVNDEITAHTTGAMHVCRHLGMPTVDTIFEIGGQDSKFIRIRDGAVIDFVMNEACAAGTGSFLEEQAEKLGVAIKSEFARLALSSRNPIKLGERCTVFMGRDVSNLLSKGASVADLCAGLAYSVALNYLNRVVRGRKIGDVIYFQGGTAFNDAVAAAFSMILKKPIVVPPHNGVIGAIGMALIARDRMLASRADTRFRGFNLQRVKWTSRNFVCRACSNYCDMKEFVIDGEKSYWGDQCSDKFRKRSRTERRPVIEDLLAWRDRRLIEVLQPPREGRKTVGIPRAMFYHDRFPFWCAYLQKLGYNVVVSDPTDRCIAGKGEELAIAQPCFPVQVAHGHVQALLESGVDYILLPNAVDAETPFMQAESKLCPWNQTLPFVVRAVQKFEPRLDGKLFCPTIHFRQGQQLVRLELRRLADQLGLSKTASDLAVAEAYRAQRQFADSLQRAGQEALQALRARGEPAVVLLGRPYNIYDRAVCCDIPRKLRALYGVNVVPLDFLPLDGEDVSQINENMYWHSGRLILSAARFARTNPDLHLIYISNFKCGPDSYLKSFLEEASGKPSLVLQFDGHSNDAGYITRCEAFLDSTGFLRCQSSNIAA
ncbi:MAG TPA: acyl-CoA dehydratase activase [Terriglobales bacterium]|nr:acyl-CoA dehydratase activase [Terriglobales bacterium]